MTTTATHVEAPAAGLETAVCSRCIGSGRYSYCAMYGDRCFKCMGAGSGYTKRGLAAREYLVKIRSRPVAELVPGRLVKLHKEFSPVVSVTKGPRHYQTIIDGVAQPAPEVWTVKTTTFSKVFNDEFDLVRVALSAEEKAETMALALAYQETLTKAGTPRKRR